MVFLRPDHVPPVLLVIIVLVIRQQCPVMLVKVPLRRLHQQIVAPHVLLVKFLLKAEHVLHVVPVKLLMRGAYHASTALPEKLLLKAECVLHVLPVKVLLKADHVPHVLLVIIVLVVSRRYPVRPGHILMRRLRVHTPMIVRNVLSLIIVLVVRQH